MPARPRPPRRVLVTATAAAAAVALLLAFVFLCLPSDPVAPAPPGRGPSSLGGYMVIAIAVIAIWGSWIYMRCSDLTICRLLAAVCTLMGLWLLLVLVKYPMRNDAWVRALWYAYYVPMLLIPALIFAMGLRMAAVRDRRLARGAAAAALAVSVALSIVVFANSSHGLVFGFDPQDPAFSANYTYGPLYWVVAGWKVALYAAFFGLLFVAARRRLKSALVPLGILCVLAGLYVLAYVLRWEVAAGSNFSFRYVLLVMVGLELCLRTGLLPSSHNYRELFSSLPLDAKVLDATGAVGLATRGAGELAPEAQAQALGMPLKGPRGATFSTADDPATVYRVLPVEGGRLVVTEDQTEINEGLRRLRLQTRELEERRDVLRGETAVRQRLAQQETEAETLGAVSVALQWAMDEIVHTLAVTAPGAAGYTPEARDRALREVRFLVAYCKRRGALTVAERGGEDLEPEQVGLILAEAGADAVALGLECGAVSSLERPISAVEATGLCDLLFGLGLLCSRSSAEALLLAATSDGDAVRARATVDCPGVDAAALMAREARRLVARLAPAFGEASVEQDESAVLVTVLVATLPEGPTRPVEGVA